MPKLTAMAVVRIAKAGRYGDGEGLYLLVGPNGGKSWVFRYKVGKRERGMGLGPFPTISLTDARTKAYECRRMRANRDDPLEARNTERENAAAALRGLKTFKECAENYINAYEGAWKNPKHRQQWRNTLTTYAYPVIGNYAVSKIDVPDVLSVLEPILVRCPETASRLRGRIEAILDWAKVRKMREGENPARWKANLDHALPNKTKIRKISHHSALDYSQLPKFLETVERIVSPTSLALQFLILTAARTTEVIQARWSEVDLDTSIWTIPAERMKAGSEHRVPISALGKCVLAKARQLDVQTGYIFKGRVPEKPLSNMAMLALIRREHPGVTAHGFRSTFRDWAAEITSHSSEVIEMALAHAIESKVEAAYRRGDLFTKRRELMEAWAQFVKPVFKGALAMVDK